MALPGPAPKPNKIGRTPNADWTDVPNVPNLDGRSRELPVRVVPDTDEEGKSLFTEGGWSEQTATWWDVVRTLPHSSDWTEADWLFATDTAYLKESFYLGTAGSGEMTEMRRREDLIGMSAEARRKLRIRYVAPRDAAPETSVEASDNVTPISRPGRRRRVLED